ncbi:AAA family ATPase [Pseudoxanthomonas sp.]|uniref:AAA family ATPase n=1 Tax=Pseudoxanthomonas sp. TaxID=1871049 RepID=UPI0025EFC572|nr:AAA family ATPase [Pseudoxanthomonas sp.]
MIRKFSKISGIGVFSAYEWPENLEEFSARNVIYGWNYSGKTTLSRIARSLSSGNTSALPAGGRFEILMDGASLSSGSISSPDANVRVFNADSVEASLLWNGGAAPILVLGEDSVLFQQQQAALKTRLKKSQIIREAREAFKAGLQAEIDRNMSDIALRVKNDLSLPVFNRAPHLLNALQAASRREEASAEDVAKWWGVLQSEEKTSQKITMPSTDWINGLAAAQCHLKEVAIRISIKRLVEKSALSAWVSEGVDLHAAGDRCAFCEGEITDARWRELEDHHSDSVRQQSGAIRRSLGTMPTTISLHIPSDSNFYPDLRSRVSELSVRVLRLKERIDARIAELRSALERKLDAPDAVIDCPKRPIAALMRLLRRYLDDMSLVVAEHNSRVAEGSSLRSVAKTRLTEYLSVNLFKDRMLLRQQERVDSWVSLIEGRQRYENSLRSRIQDLEGEISRRSIGADRLNYLLKMYFGSDRLRIAAVSGRFQLMRGGSVAGNLSEGEKTAIAFSYFIAKLEEVGSDIGGMTVYVDDPISSLDSNHVFNTFSLIKSRLSKCKQIFISTHNFEFFRLLKTDPFFREIKKEKRVASFYYIRRSGDSSELCALPRAVSRYSSEYHLLFDTLIKFREDSSKVDHIVIPNVLRRMLETYTKFRFPSSSETLDQRLLRIFDEEVAVRTYKLINHLSHSDNASSLHEFPDESEIEAVLDSVMLRLEEFDRDHITGMKEACAS